MATIICCSLFSSPSSHFHSFQHSTNSKFRLSQFVNRHSVVHRTIYEDKSYQYIHGVPKKLRGRIEKQHTVLVVGSGNQPQTSGLQEAILVPERHDSISENIFPIGKSCFHLSGNGGKRGVVPFCNRSRDYEVISSNSERALNSISGIFGPAILVVSFIFPPSFLPEMLVKIFGDTPLTIFSLLFLTEAVFYCGVAVFLLLLDSLLRRIQPNHSANESYTLTLQLGHQISSVANLVLGITIPIAAMVLSWPWTLPIVPTTLVPHLVGTVVQFTFEQLARYWKSPSWAAIPFIFQVYRLHQIHRAGNLLTHVSFYSKLPVACLRMLSNVLNILLVICVWSFTRFLIRLLLQLRSDAKTM